jgi:diguanylate cyclase (GGDEF)-like protein/PAS domain S-box-containing protein
MAKLLQVNIRLSPGDSPPESAPPHRRRPLRVLFVHREAEAIDSCLQELKKGQFTVTSDFVLNIAQLQASHPSHFYDVVLVEYPSPGCKGPKGLQILSQLAIDIPVILLTTAREILPFAELNPSGAFECVQREYLAQLPMSVRRALNEKKLRTELEEAQKALQHSQSLYRALVDNPAYGIYRCNAEGELLDVNLALTTMLGYASREQLLAANKDSVIIPDIRLGLPFAGRSTDSRSLQPIETDWKRKDGAPLKARLSGRGVFDEQGNFAGLEVIVVDITEQRTLEEQLRHQASSDSLTGLANYRRLFEALHAEICRSKRTGRDFSLLLLDLDGLKKINDRFGHQAGDRALCRLGQTLRDCSRSIDTAARHGGDEFALVLPETGMADATLVARRICELLESETAEPVLSVSFGIATYPRDAETIGTLLYAADRALYALKVEKPNSSRPSSAPDSPPTDSDSWLSPRRELLESELKRKAAHEQK